MWVTERAYIKPICHIDFRRTNTLIKDFSVMLLNYKLKLFILALFSLKSDPEVNENNLSVAMINGQTPVTRTKTSWGATSGGFSNSPTKVWLQSNLIPSVIFIYVFKFTLFLL